MKVLSRVLIYGLFTFSFIVCGAWIYAGPFGLNVLARHGGAYWLPVSAGSSRLSPGMRAALNSEEFAIPGGFAWRSIVEGFEVGELPVMTQGKEVDRIFVERIDPARFRFGVFSAPAGDKGLDQWMQALDAVLVVNGSYYARNGSPDTPFLSNGIQLGPREYDAHAGAFVASSSSAGIRNLEHESWKKAFEGVDNAMVSYPLLIADGKSHVAKPSRWLANRSFVGEDNAGWIIIGTTKDAFFTLDRLAKFLLVAPLDLKTALNLDGGPVASQGVTLHGYKSRIYGRWELQTEGNRASLLTWPYGTMPLPVVLAVFPKK